MRKNFIWRDLNTWLELVTSKNQRKKKIIKQERYIYLKCYFFIRMELWSWMTS